MSFPRVLLCRGVFHGNVGIQKPLRLGAVSRLLAARVGGHRQGSPRYSYNAGSVGLVNGAGYPARSWGVVGFVDDHRTKSLLLFFTTVPNTKLCAWGEEDSGGHVL
jgi:hypothetical protein